jgi:hypothetical protein
LDRVLIRTRGAESPHAYGGLPADADWRLSGVWRAADGSEHVVELHFASRAEAEDFAERELGLSGRWDDPDGDGNHCIVD